jgi:hypothetical protein
MQHSKRAGYQERAASFLLVDSTDRSFSSQTVGTLSVTDIERALAARRAVAARKAELGRDLDDFLSCFQAIMARIREVGDLLAELRQHWEQDEDAARTLARLIYDQSLDDVLIQIAGTLSGYSRTYDDASDWTPAADRAVSLPQPATNGNRPLPEMTMPDIRPSTEPEADGAVSTAVLVDGHDPLPTAAGVTDGSLATLASTMDGTVAAPEAPSVAGDAAAPGADDSFAATIVTSWEETIQSWGRIVESWEAPQAPMDPQASSVSAEVIPGVAGDALSSGSDPAD